MSHRTTFLFGFLFSLMLLPSILKAQCDTLRNTLPTDTPAVFTSDSGYISGHNEFGDISKAERFTVAGTREVTDVALIFAVAKFANANAAVTVKLWDDDGANGTPGTVLGSGAVLISTIVSNFDTMSNTSTMVLTFNTPQVVSGAFYAGISFTYTAGDTVALLSTRELTRAGTAWEQWGDNTWHAFSDTLGWDLNLSHFIFARTCPSTVGVGDVAANYITVRTAPNPFTAATTISVDGIRDTYDFTLYDVTGKMQRQLRGLDAAQFTLNRDGLTSGLYFYLLSTAKGGVVKGSLMVE